MTLELFRRSSSTRTSFRNQSVINSRLTLNERGEVTGHDLSQQVTDRPESASGLG